MRALADDRSIIIKNADKDSAVVVWGRNDYILEDEKQFSDANVYVDVFRLMKKFCRTLWIQVISFFKPSSLKGKLVINSLNTLRMSIKKFLT